MIAAAVATAICLAKPELWMNPAEAWRTVSHPKFPTQPVAAEALVPKGWTVEERLSGDLDGDRRPDLVLVLRGADPVCIVRHGGFGTDPLDTNPRAVVAALATPAGFRVIAVNDRLIGRHLAPTVFEPPGDGGGYTLANGALVVDLRFFASSGTYRVASRKFIFRWRGGRLVLVGFDSMEGSRSTLAFEDTSVNYLTGRMKLTIEKEQRPPQSRWVSRPRKPLLDLSQIGDAWEFEP